MTGFAAPSPAIRASDGSVSSYVGILADITALKLHEAELERIALYASAHTHLHTRFQRSRERLSTRAAAH